MEKQVRCTQLWKYPVKSLGGISCQKLNLVSSGVEGDRMYMIVDSLGHCITQRKYPDLAAVHFTQRADGLFCRINEKVHKISMVPFGHPREVTIWQSACQTECYDPVASQWLSERLQSEVYLVAFSPQTRREKYIEKTQSKIPLLFTDGYPVHIVSQSSLDDLSDRMGYDIDPLRFRPNMVIEGLAPYEEEGLATVSSQGAVLRIIKPTVRCSIPNIDQMTGMMGREPLKTLSKYKKQGNTICFGVYAIVQKKGEVLCNENLSLIFN